MVKRNVSFLLAAIILLLPMMTALSEYCSTASHFTTGLIAINECIQGEGNVSFLLDIDVPTDVVIYSTGCEVYLGGSKEEKQHLEVGLYSVCIRSEGEFSVLIADEKAIGEADSLGDLLERMQEGTVLSSDIPGAVEDDMDASWESVTTPSDIYEMLPEQEADVFSAPDAMTSFTVVSEGNTVHLSFDAAACIPDDAEFVVQVLDPMSEEYVHYTDTALSAVPGPSQILALYDLSIMREGEEIEPQAPVMVTVDFGGSLPRDATLYAIHFPETESAAMTRPMHAPSLAPSALNTRMQQATSPRIETIGADYDGAGSATFVASSFSVFAIVYTVDFHWEVNGKMYNINIPGGDFVSFTDLVEVLGIAKEAVTKEFYGDADGSIDGKISAPLTQRDVIISEDTRKFVADVNSITFSTPKFLSVSKVDSSTTVGEIKDELGLECEYSAELAEEQIAEINAQIVDAEDWALICVQPFSSTEYLTVTMKNGDSFEIRVTDAQIRRRVISASGETYEITVTYGVDAQIPDDAELKVREIVEEDVDYQEYYDATVEKLGTAGTQGEVFVGNTVIQDCYAHIFDIEIWADGQKVEPAAYVAVSIKLLDVSEDEVFDLMVVHFSKDGLEIMELAENAEKAGVTELSFVTDEFSVYTIISSGTTTNLNGQSFAIGNANTNNFMMAIRQGNDRLQALHYSVTGDTVITTSENDISRWTFTSSTKGGNWYYISDSSGNYLNIGNGNNPYVTVSQNPQEIYVRANGNRVRLQLTNTDNSTAVNNYGGTTAGGFGPYNDQGNNEWFTLYNITVAEEGKVGVYVYVAAEQWKNNPEFMDLIGVGYTDPYDYFPAGVIYLDASFFDGKTNFSALIQSEEDWAEIVEALEKIDTSLLSGEGDPNRGNHIGNMLGKQSVI